MLRRLSAVASGRRSKWIVLTIWLVVAFALSPFQSKLQEATKNEPEAFLPRTSEGTQVVETLKHRFPEGRDVPAVVVFASADGAPITRAQRERISARLRAISRPGVLESAGRPISPVLPDGGFDPRAEGRGLLSSDRSTAVVLIPMNPEDSDPLQQNVDRIRDEIGAHKPADRNGGLEAHVTGPAGLSVDAIEVFNSIDGTLLLASVSLILILLLLVYRSPLVALVPLIVVGTAYTIAAGIVYAFIQTTGFEVNGQTTGILIVLMFGAGTDYCLLIVSRFREELRTTEDKHGAMARATRRTAPAILSAGGTVFAAMLVLGLADLKSTQNLGPVLAVGIAVTLLAGLTLLPALLAILGRRSFWPRIPRLGTQTQKPSGIWRRIGHVVHERPFLVMTVSIIVLGMGALGNFVDTGKLSFGAGFRDTTDSTEGSNVLERKLPPGEAGTGNVIVSPAAVANVSKALEAVPGVAAVRTQSRSSDGKLVRLSLVLEDDPYGDAAASRVPLLRRTARQAAAGAPPVEPGGRAALVGGISAENFDTYETLNDDAKLIVPAILLLVFLILAVLLRALVAPVYLVLTVVLSFAFALGASKLIFTQLMDQHQVEPSLPTLAFLFLVALGVDYNIFLISRVREEDARLGIREGVISALERTGGVITSAGLILVGTFLTLTILPLDSLFQMGVTVALGLLVDTFLVRVFLVPAIAFQLGELNWWPSRHGD